MKVVGMKTALTGLGVIVVGGGTRTEDQKPKSKVQSHKKVKSPRFRGFKPHRSAAEPGPPSVAGYCGGQVHERGYERHAV